MAELVRDKVQGYEATKFNKKDRKIPVRVRLSDIEKANVEELKSLVVNPGQERPLPLEAVAEIKVGRGPNQIRRVDQQRVGIVTANVEGMCGVVEDGILPGLFGYEAGQSGVGDIFAWFVDNLVPAEYFETAEREGQNLVVADVIADQNVVLVRGAIPGPNGGFVVVRKAIKKRKKT